MQEFIWWLRNRNAFAGPYDCRLKPSEKSIREDLAVGDYDREFGNLSGMVRDRQKFPRFPELRKLE
jgi:hypothetical protein